jgi:putative transposase
MATKRPDAGPICVEDLDVKDLKEMGQNTGMHRSIHDASWYKFIFMLSHKPQNAGRKLIKVDPRNTTQRCYCKERTLLQSM